MTDPNNKFSEEIRKDTSLPGREEEVIVNSDAQQAITNSDDTGNNASTDIAQDPQAPVTGIMPGTEQEVINKERGFEEGLADDSNTTPPTD